jgi:SPOC domain
LNDIPEQLTILGRLRIVDLWHYIRDSLHARDIVILSLASSSTTNNPDGYLQYVHDMRQSNRAAILTKRVDSVSIHDMYILPGDTLECPHTIVTTFSLPIVSFSKQLFLVVIGSTKRSSKSTCYSDDHHSLVNLTYKPVALQDSFVVRDPRLFRQRDVQHVEYYSTTKAQQVDIQTNCMKNARIQT